MGERELRHVISGVEDLPTLPRTVMRITEFINDPRSSARDLAGLISDDPVLTARLLRIVNSSFYAFPQRIATVTEAILLLGFDAIRHLLLTTSVFNIFPAQSRKGRHELEHFWDHSLGCAIGAKAVGRFLGHDKLEELFVAGLLHDIGKIVEMMKLPEQFSEVTRRVREHNVLIAVAEAEVLGFTHAESGQLLAEHWNLPAKLTGVIAHHHHPSAAGPFGAEALIVHVADILARALGLGSGGDDKVPPRDEAAWQGLKLNSGAFDAIMAAMLVEFEEIRAFLN
jgi:HD-like signal output (HDOD) protein